MPPQDRGQTPPDGVLEVYTEIRELVPTGYESLLWKIRLWSFNSHTGVGLISQDPFSLDGVSRVPKSPSRAYV